MILSIGEILVDIFIDGDKKTVFPGGAPFNLASNIATFDNKEVMFMGCVGNDEYGHFLEEIATKKINHPYILSLDNRHTSEAIVTLRDGERTFKFNRSLGADYVLDINELKKIDLSNLKIIHIGSLMLSHKEGREFFFEAVNYIRNNSKALISFDVNYRDDIFENEKEAKEIFISSLKCADIIKFSEDELKLLSNKENLLDGLKTLLNEKQIAVVTLGKEGSLYFDSSKNFKVETILLKPVDTTGAGDAFYSYFLYRIDKGLDLSNIEEIKSALLRANVVGGLATQRKGAIDVVPNHDEIEEFLKKHK